MKKYHWLFLFMLIISGASRGEDVRMRDVFRQMPDSLLPTLSANNRLDMIDFLDSNMKAEVTNLLGGKSEMTALTDDSLSLRMNDVQTVNMMLLKTEEMVDSCQQIICVMRIYGTDSLDLDTKVTTYSMAWRRVENPPLSEEVNKRMNASFKKTIVKRIGKILKKD